MGLILDHLLFWSSHNTSCAFINIKQNREKTSFFWKCICALMLKAKKLRLQYGQRTSEGVGVLGYWQRIHRDPLLTGLISHRCCHICIWVGWRLDKHLSVSVLFFECFLRSSCCVVLCRCIVAALGSGVSFHGYTVWVWSLIRYQKPGELDNDTIRQGEQQTLSHLYRFTVAFWLKTLREKISVWGFFQRPLLWLPDAIMKQSHCNALAGCVFSSSANLCINQPNPHLYDSLQETY